MTAPPLQLAEALRDRYVLERELGRGGMASVYLAQDLRHHRRVALKVLGPELGLGLAPERFRREIETVAQLEHPHILPVHDSGETAGHLWYAMPYVEGESLRGRLERERQLSVEEALRLTREVADALDYAHSRGIVHRDIKPENILLGRGHARVADFGIARALGAAADRLTGTGLTLGTPAYLSPEQAAGGQADARSDVYALGCVLYEMLTGEPPFTGPTPQAVIGRRFVEQPPPIRLVREAVPTEVEAAVARALALEPADRFQTAGELRDALAGAALAAPRSPVPRAPTVWLSRRWFILGPAALVAGLGLALWNQSRRLSGIATEAPAAEASTANRLAVLPFEHLGDSAEAYFADGLSDEVRGKLAALPELEVIAGASSDDYRRTTKPPREIAGELGVRYLLVGKVRTEKSAGGGPARVRVSPELVEVTARGPPTTKWQAPFEAPLTGVFEVQAAIAARVAEALGVALGVRERQALAAAPTQNLDAYKAYLRGEAVWVTDSPNPTIARQALPYYEQALALDSNFVEAWYRLAGAHLRIYGSGGTLSPAEAEAGRTAAERALAVAPDRPEGPVALGNYYLAVHNDTRRALEQFTLALRKAPNFLDALAFAGYAELYLGRWDRALEHFRQASTLDPRAPWAVASLAQTLLWLRRHAEAHPLADRALALAPASTGYVEYKAMIHLAQGDLSGARAVIRSALERIEPATLVAWFGWSWDLYWVLEESEQQLLLRLPPSAYDNNRASWGLILAQTYALRGDQARARVYADSARLAFEEQLRGAPQDAQLHALYGLALAYLGRKVDAVREGERGVALAPLTEQAANGAYVRHQLARIHLLVGEPEKALDQLELLLKIPYYLSPGWLRIDPTFASLRRHPRFRRLLEDTA